MIRSELTKKWIRLAQMFGSVGLGLWCIWMLSRHLPEALTVVFWHSVLAELRNLPLASVGLAALCVCVSFLALGRYDAVAHRHFRTGIPGGKAAISGTVAIALSQTLGLGLLTGAFARWRMLPGIGMGLALRLSGFVCLTFTAALAIIAACACLILQPQTLMTWPALAVLFFGTGLFVFLFFRPSLRLGGKAIRLPSLTACGSILVWTAIDTFAAATALYLLIPDASVSFALLLPAFLLALVAALISGTPGGVGPFELVLFSLLPDAAAVGAVSGVIAFRALYYALPALIAALALIRPLLFVQPLAQTSRVPPQTEAPRAEIGVIRQNGGTLMPLQDGAAAVWPSGQTLCALFDPIGHTKDLPGTLKSAARDANLLPLMYKCSARAALAARHAGWRILHIADEAVIDPAQFDTERPHCRSLRRKLRRAQNAGIRAITPAILPLEAMTAIDAEWRAKRGTARGGTMGRFCAAYLTEQRVVIALHNGQPVAFASFHASRYEWCLDLMRQTAQAPDGTMHLLLHHAIVQAAQARIPRFSLAAIPACPNPQNAIWRAVARQMVHRSGGPGLRQFKSAFHPRWQPLYAAAPSYAALTLGLADIAHAVHRPDPTVSSDQAHYLDENYELARVLAS